MASVEEGFKYSTDKKVPVGSQIIALIGILVDGNLDDYDMLDAIRQYSQNSLVLDGTWRYLRWEPSQKTLVLSIQDPNGGGVFCGAYQRAGNLWTFRLSPDWIVVRDGEIRELRRRYGQRSVVVQVQNPVNTTDDLPTDIWYRFTLENNLSDVTDSKVPEAPFKFS